jgi:hypothetical protein
MPRGDDELRHDPQLLRYRGRDRDALQTADSAREVIGYPWRHGCVHIVQFGVSRLTHLTERFGVLAGETDELLQATPAGRDLTEKVPTPAHQLFATAG